MLCSSWVCTVCTTVDDGVAIGVGCSITGWGWKWVCWDSITMDFLLKLFGLVGSGVEGWSFGVSVVFILEFKVSGVVDWVKLFDCF